MCSMTSSERVFAVITTDCSAHCSLREHALSYRSLRLEPVRPLVRAATCSRTASSRVVSPSVSVCRMLSRSWNVGLGISYLAPKRRTIAASSAE